ncbi:MAG TPA: ATP-binding protein [Pyrinomonadaceae bacterium]|nr:ATP-binding protein [Pyrinomonadaceae bacterium]
MKHLVSSSLKSCLISAALSVGVSAIVGALWNAGVLASPGAVFLLNDAANPSVAPQTWVALLLIFAAGVGAGFAVERAGARRASLFVAASLMLLCASSFVVSRFLHLDIVFAPMLLAAAAAMSVVQLQKLWLVDSALTRNIMRVSSQVSTLEGSKASARLMSGLKLLDTVLPLDEAVIFRLDETGKPAQAARLRSAAGAATAGGAAEVNRNSAWREAVRLCERAIASGEMLIQTQEQAGGEATQATIILPLAHEGRAVGALLLRLRENFDETDRPLLATVSAQFARNLQRDEARTLAAPEERRTIFSVPAAGSRLEYFGVVSGLLTEQSFAAHVLAEASDGHAVAYLDGTIAYANKPMLEAARLTTKECRALDLFDLLDRFRGGVFDEPSIAVRRVLQTGEPYERELPFNDRNQTLALRIALVTEAERAKSREGDAPPPPLCLAVTVRDVTRMKEYEKLKSDMVSLMSHELRTPITSINGFAELLAGDETIPAEAREFLGIINSESQRLTRMINTFLSVTKLEQKDKQEVLKIPLMLDDVVRETIASYQPVAKRKRIRLVEKDGTKLPPVAADRSLITRVVSNLVENAIKYSPERTTVTLSTALEADAVRVLVEDRGYGVPPESVDRVWEKFYRVARDGHDKEDESTGLGLSFVREVVEQHGGCVGLESEVGRGSKFSFTLPRL